MGRHHGADQLRRRGEVAFWKIHLAVRLVDGIACQYTVSLATTQHGLSRLHRHPSDFFPNGMLRVCDRRTSHGLQRHLKLPSFRRALTRAQGHAAVPRHRARDDDGGRWELLVEIDLRPFATSVPHFSHTALKLLTIRHRINAAFASKIWHVQHLLALNTLSCNIQDPAHGGVGLLLERRSIFRLHRCACRKHLTMFAACSTDSRVAAALSILEALGHAMLDALMRRAQGNGASSDIWGQGRTDCVLSADAHRLRVTFLASGW